MPRIAPRAAASAVALVMVALAGCSDDAPDAASTTGGATMTETAPPAGRGIALTQIATGLEGALLVTGRPGDDRLYVVEQIGRIRALSGGAPEPDAFLDVTDLTAAGGERGLLGLAFHPAHADNGLFYVNYTDREGTTLIVEYRAGADSAVDDSARELLSIPQPFGNHNGGNLAFGPDGMLYIGMGDGGSGGDPEDNGQRLDTLLGAMLRIDVDSRGPADEPYGIPADNPFVDREGARPEIWALGLRNPWRFSFDAQTGDLWIGDVGQNAVEEIDRVPATSSGAGANFGWNRLEGTEIFSAGGEGLSVAPAVPPVAQYGHDEGCSVTGGHVYRGAGVPALDGRYVYGDFCSGRVWTLGADVDPGAPQEITDAIGGPLNNLTSFGIDNDGALYAATGDAVVRFDAG